MDFYNNPSNVDEYEKMCEGYDGSKLYEVLEKYLKPSSTLLELGSGLGYDLDYLKAHYKVTGSDLSDEFISRCRTRHKDIPIIKLDAVQIETQDTFDAIFSNKVLHHLKPETLEHSLQRQQQVIHPHGVFAHTFWLGDKEFMMEGMLFVFYQKEVLLSLVAKYFTIVEAYEYGEFEEGDSLMIIARNDM